MEAELEMIFSHGRSVSFTCHHGFELKGDIKTTCNDGAWSGNATQCQGKSHHTTITITMIIITILILILILELILTLILILVWILILMLMLILILH